MPVSPARWTVPATAEQIPLLREQVTRFAEAAGIAKGRLGDVRLAISEATTNAVLHAYRDRDPGEIRVSASVDPVDDCLMITVEDDGFGPLPRPDSPGLGLGLPTIATVADALELSAGGAAGARLCMRFATAE